MDPESAPQATTTAPAPVQANPAPTAAPVQATPAPAAAQPVTPAPQAAEPTAIPVQGAPNNPAAPAVPAQTQPAPKPTALTVVESALRGKTAILAENKVFKQRAEAAESALATTQAELATAQTELASLKAEHAQIEGLLSAAQESEKTVVQQATDMVAQSNIPIEELPKQEAEGSDFLSQYKAAEKAGGATLGKFMKDNKSEINAMLRGEG